MSSIHFTIQAILINGNLTNGGEVCMKRSKVNSIGTKPKMINYVLRTMFPSDMCLSRETIQIERKVRKGSHYIRLETPEHFEAYIRSLRVRGNSHLILRVLDDPPPSSPATSAAQDSASVSENLQKQIPELKSCNEQMCMLSTSVKTHECECHNTSKDTPTGEDEKRHQVVHNGVLCDKCEPHSSTAFLKGIRYKCMDCVDFDLCEDCFRSEVSVGSHKPQHSMIAIRDPAYFAHTVRSGPVFCNGIPFCRPVSCIRTNAVSGSCCQENLEDKISTSRSARRLEELESLLPEVADDKFERLKEIVLNSQKPQESAQEKDDANVVNVKMPASKLELVLVPKGKSLSQILISNRGTTTLDCKNMTLSIVNCFGTQVALAAVEIPQGIMPGRTSKINLQVNSSHFKYPFKVELKGGNFSGKCQLSLKNLSGELVSNPVLEEQTEEPKSELVQHETSGSMESEMASSANSFFTAFMHSIRLPSLPKEVSPVDSKKTKLPEKDNSSQAEANDEDDYDVISISDAEDLGSDYEILSQTNSAEH